MREKERYIPEGSNDMECLMYAMNQLKNRNFGEIDSSAFEKAEVADAYNGMLDAIMGYNNYFLMRINDAMIRIADNGKVKDMLTQIKSQKEPIENMREANDCLSLRIKNNEKRLIEVLAMSKQVDNTLAPCVRKMMESEQILEGSIKGIEESLNKKDVSKQELLQACEDAREQEKRALMILRHTTECVRDVGEQVNIVRKDAGEIFTRDNELMDVFRQFTIGLQLLTDNYEKLSKNCYDVGSQLYRISRDVDNARNDMFRNNSRPTLLDRLSVFYVDHLTLTWRLYFNIIEYDILRITQLNNPDCCKFGLWCAEMTDLQIRDSEAFQEAFDAHEKLHKYSVACFLAKEASDVQEAMKEFNNALGECMRFQKALQKLGQHMRTLGITEQTEVWKFQE